MAFVHVRGPAVAESFQKLASTAIAAGSLLGIKESVGFVSQALVESTRIIGVAVQKIASTDSDFADNSTISVIIPTFRSRFVVPTSGTATQSDVGNRYDLTKVAGGTSQAVNLSGTTFGVVTVTKFIDASTVEVAINGAYQVADINT